MWSDVEVCSMVLDVAYDSVAIMMKRRIRYCGSKTLIPYRKMKKETMIDLKSMYICINSGLITSRGQSDLSIQGNYLSLYY